MEKKVVLIGHCGPDSSYLRMAVGNVDKSIRVSSADDPVTLQRALDGGADLLLLNRELPYEFDDQLGVDVIRKFASKYPGIKMMLVSNHPDAQQSAERAGAVPGFGKKEIGTARVPRVIRSALGLGDK